MNPSVKKTTSNELVYDLVVNTKEEALNFLYRAGIVTKKGNLRKFYRVSTTSKTKDMKSEQRRIVSPEEVLQEYEFKPKTKEEALDFLYQAGIVTKNGNYRKIYQTAKTHTTQ